MRWIVDAQLPPALARMLAEHGHTAEHLVDVGLRHSSDETIWDYAEEHAAVIVTKDEDFPNRALIESSHPAIVWLRIGNCSRRALLQWFEPLLPDIVSRIESGETLIEIR